MKGKMPLIIIIFLLLVIGGGVFAGFSLGWFSPGQKAQKDPEPPKEYTFAIGDYTVNLNEPGYKRYIMVSLSAGYTTEGLDAELTEKLPQISDIVNSVLRSKKLDEVDTPEKTDVIKGEMMSKINTGLTKGKLTNIYFNKILIQ